MVYMGIDPGKNGGIAFLIQTDYEDTVLAYPFSEDILIDKINELCMKHHIECVVEDVHAMPHQGVVSMFNFGKNFGFIQGCLRSFEIDFKLVSPIKWKKELNVTSDKHTSIARCKELFPDVNLLKNKRCRKEHDGMAEAVLLAEYCRRNYVKAGTTND